ncbi:MAG: sigma-70 family RNA polymerase sigma factor [Chloroflexota bacterium]
MQDEESLVKRAQQRDEAAFTRLYEENFKKIYRYCALRIGNEMEAEDMAQQVFLRALESIGSYKWKGVPFSSWLFRIAHNQVVDYHRKRVKRVTIPLEDEIAGPSSDDPSELCEQKVDIEEVGLAVKRLTQAQREVISLRFAAELPIAEVAKIMGKSEGAIKALQHSAVVTLRKILSEE